MAKQLDHDTINLMHIDRPDTTTSTGSTTPQDGNEDIIPDTDEPPDDSTPRPSVQKVDSFKKSKPQAPLRTQSLLTQALVSGSEAESSEEEVPVSSRESSCASTGDLTSDCGFTSCSTRMESPSPPSPATVFKLPVFGKPATRIHDDEFIEPLEIIAEVPTAEQAVEAGLGRKRCIMFAGATKTSSDPPKPVEKPKEKAAEQSTAPKRACTIRFACPNKVSTEKPQGESKPKPVRAASPAPSRLQAEWRQASPLSHRGSDSTLRNESPKASRKLSPFVLARAQSGNPELGRTEATRFHVFASSDDEADDWTHETTVPRARLTVSDTLRIENGLRKLGEEAEEEALEEELEEDVDDDAEDELDDNDDVTDDIEDESDDGFHTDNEAGFASSDEDSDGEEDFKWWAPGGSTAATSYDRITDAARPNHGHRSFSQSSLDSDDGEEHDFFRQASKTKKRRTQPVDIRVPTPELPDSTDFVCGTLDEDKAAEEAFASAIEKKRAAKHRPTPQDIDPSFPTSDPEMDEEDECDEAEKAATEESDQHPMVHGTLDSIDGTVARGRFRRSPAQSPKRLRSPPPLSRRTTAIKSPAPPRRLFGHSPHRTRSPAPHRRSNSPPPTRRPSLLQSPPTIKANYLHFIGLAERPQLTITASLPRHAITQPPSPMYDDEDSGLEMPSRGAIDIKAGLERKRQRRREKLYQKHCRKQQREGEKRPQPGKGCERMREIGMEIAAYRSGKRVVPQNAPRDALMISI